MERRGGENSPGLALYGYYLPFQRAGVAQESQRDGDVRVAGRDHRERRAESGGSANRANAGVCRGDGPGVQFRERICAGIGPDFAGTPRKEPVKLLIRATN